MEDILSLQDISISFGGVEVLHNVSFNVRKGEILSLIGENGAGKSTLLKIISGVYIPDTGKIIKSGKEIKLRNPLDAFAEHIGIVHQELSIAGNLTVAENMMVGREPVNKLGFIKDKELLETARKELKDLGIDVDPAVKAGTLSVGMQQVIEIAKVLAKDIDLLIMDEPTSSLSEREIVHLFALLREIKKKKDLTVIFISILLVVIFTNLPGFFSLLGAVGKEYLADVAQLGKERIEVARLAHIDRNSCLFKLRHRELIVKYPGACVEKLAAGVDNLLCGGVAHGQRGDGVNGVLIARKRTVRVIFHALSDDLIAQPERAENLRAVWTRRHDLLRHRRDGYAHAVVEKAHGLVAILHRRRRLGSRQWLLGRAGCRGKRQTQRKQYCNNSFHYKFS